MITHEVVAHDCHKCNDPIVMDCKNCSNIAVLAMVESAATAARMINSEFWPRKCEIREVNN